MNIIFINFDVLTSKLNSDGTLREETIAVLKILQDRTNSILVSTNSFDYYKENEVGNKKYANNFLTVIDELAEFDMYISNFLTIDKSMEDTIIKYLTTNKVKNYLILDNEYISEILLGHELIVDNNGLSTKYIKPATEILSGRLLIHPKSFRYDEIDNKKTITK